MITRYVVIIHVSSIKHAQLGFYIRYTKVIQCNPICNSLKINACLTTAKFYVINNGTLIDTYWAIL